MQLLGVAAEPAKKRTASTAASPGKCSFICQQKRPVQSQEPSPGECVPEHTKLQRFWTTLNKKQFQVGSQDNENSIFTELCCFKGRAVLILAVYLLHTFLILNSFLRVPFHSPCPSPKTQVPEQCIFLPFWRQWRGLHRCLTSHIAEI